MSSLLTLEIHYEQDIVQARQRTRELAEQLGFDVQDQARLATAVSEIARNAFQYARGGTVEFYVDDAFHSLLVRVQDRGPGMPHLTDVLDGRYRSSTGMGVGIIGSKRLMDFFEIESLLGEGTTVLMGKALPKQAAAISGEKLQHIRETVSGRSPQSPYEEIQRQNQELLRAMAELRKREEELTKLNRELEDTNRGVVALYAELDEKADSLQKANELKTRFLSNMSHEFRTPLNSVLSLSRLLLSHMDGELTDEQEKQVTFIQKAAEGLFDLVNDLLDLAKVEAGKTEVYPSLFETAELFGTLRGMLRPLLVQGSSVSLIFDEPVGIATLYTDEGKVAQILRNFISNALKFTEKGEVRIGVVQSGDTVVFSVTDTGIGITPEDQERIFEDFVQIESRLQTKVKGTGLGLPLSRKLAELLGGKVLVESELGKGSTFSAVIPIVYPHMAEAEVRSQPTWQIEPTRRPILVVEDHAETRFLYEKCLQETPYQMMAARNIDEAKQALGQFRPAAIVLDIMLDGQNGWTLLREVKGDESTRAIPVVVATVIDNEKQAMALGADGFLVKPVDRLLLLNKLNTVINQDKPQTLLLIDDDEACRYILKQFLANTALNLLEATNGYQGLELARKRQPAVIILDLVMPNMSGFEVLNELKHDSATREIPVIIYTSTLLDAEAQRTLAEQSVAILSKAVTFETAVTLEKNAQGVTTQLRDALVKAGLVLEREGESHV